MAGIHHYRGYLKRRILIPLTAVIVFTVVVFSVATLWHVMSAIQREAENQVEFAKLTSRHNVESDALKIRGFIKLLTDDAKIREAFIARDRKRLLALTTPHYAYLNSEQNITHFYFSGPDRINLLRVHNPSRHSDKIERITTLRAEQSGKLAYGLELGPLGTFTLRVVEPWFHEGKLIGYLELGEEIDHIVDDLRLNHGIDVFILINKMHLDRQAWESGMKMLGRNPDWDRYPNHILVSSPISIRSIPGPLERQLIKSEQIAIDQLIDVSVPEQRFKAVFTPLTDVSEQRVGMMLLLTPTDYWITHGQKTFWGATVLILLLGGGVFILFYRLATTTEQVLEETTENLIKESEKNSALQSQHIAELEQHYERLEQASNEVSKSHALLMEAEQLAHIGSWEWDIVSDQLTWSEEMFCIFGLDSRHFHPSHHLFLASIPIENRKRVEEAIASALEQDTPYDVEHRIIRPDGSERIVREQGKVYRDGQKPLRMIGTTQDITQPRQIEQSIRHLGHIFNNATNEIYLIDPRTLRLEQANQTAINHLGYTAEELPSLTYTEIAGDFDRERFMLLLNPLMDEERNEIEVESWHQKKSGERYPVEIRLQRSEINEDTRIIVIVLDTSERKQQQEALRHQSLHDMLTGLPNRELLHEQLIRELATAKRTATQVTLVQLDLKNFREVNDTLGHENGDLLLRQVANRLCAMVRESDTVARIAGDEFYLLLPESGVSESHDLILQIQNTLGSPFKIGDYSLNIEANGGIAVFPDHAADAAQLMRQADIALTRAKAQGSGYEIYCPEFDPFSVRRLVLNSHMRHAIERNEFCLYYQPKVTSHSRRTEEAEALIRWHHPQHAFISPSEFIPLAEESGYIRQITLWVIEETARQLAIWKSQGKEPTISVNLSARNLQDPNLIRFVVDTVRKYSISAEQLAFEITETAVMRDPDFTLGVLNDLDSMGHPIAIDDYGTGYSSLTYLRRLPASELKIDISFIRTMLDDDDSAVIVRSTIELAHSLGLRVTAEGVETSDQAEILSILDADLLQGFLFSKPVPAVQFFEMLSPK